MRKHHGLKASNVQQHDVLDVVAVEQLRHFLSIRKVLRSTIQITFLKLLNGYSIVLQKTTRIGVVVVVVSKAEGDLGYSILVFLEKSLDGSMLGRCVAF